ncbi:hypothetical protein EPUS_05945 [Endocarpon pusillum Z07020]|uniref:Uncharacterized protein n=1 Tax=Endocarpon pusillum (strain Z07020 / HMAS-L-300199) TaxID=1263415 RepID=U1HGW6_ENDPU|nr:uncharacterized protein EPUS_05945 [Endocarpon pusillum Z07020]ERF69400.1 hypothetical protein EPUS_05945 [Endocarpon pusillum Z07020]
MASFALRCPSIFDRSFTNNTSAVKVPIPDEVLGQWHITHTSSPAWRDKRNVVLTYTTLSSRNHDATSLDDLITYQTLTSPQLQTMRGTDISSTGKPGEWIWRGNGWLKFVTSHWQILGFGEQEERGQWAVVFAQKSLFSPAVINVYTRRKDGLDEEKLQELKKILRSLGDGKWGDLVEVMYIVKQE